MAPKRIDPYEGRGRREERAQREARRVRPARSRYIAQVQEAIAHEISRDRRGNNGSVWLPERRDGSGRVRCRRVRREGSRGKREKRRNMFSSVGLQGSQANLNVDPHSPKVTVDVARFGRQHGGNCWFHCAECSCAECSWRHAVVPLLRRLRGGVCRSWQRKSTKTRRKV